MRKLNPWFRAIEMQASITDKVLVSFSGGKDSVACLDLCMKYFKNVEGFFMYYVQGLSFQENIIKYYEDKYSIAIHRLPHFELSEFLRYGLFRSPDDSVPIVDIKEIYNYIRLQTGKWWIAGGERIKDSTFRRAILKKSGSVDSVRGRIYPLVDWNKYETLAYLKQNKLKVGEDSRVLGFSFASFQAMELLRLKDAFPRDFKKLETWFPLANASIMNYQLRGGKKPHGNSKEARKKKELYA